jgi:diaminopimelate decarboxylase
MFLTHDMCFRLKEKYGTPLYVYSEEILRERCRDIKNLLPDKNVRINYSAKANTNLELLKIIREEGLDVDAMSPGEIYIELMAGFKPEQIFYISNNVSAEEMKYAIDRNVMVGVDSLSQLETFGQINPGGRVAVRFNPGVGAGHHEKVITAGKKTKFGVQKEFIPEVKAILTKYNLKLAGINQHIGSLFLDGQAYVDSVKSFLEIAREFRSLSFIDLGGGFGVPYRKEEKPLDLKKLGEELDKVLSDFLKEYPNKDVIFKMEPGRYIVCECGLLLGTVQSVKINYENTYIGTDIGFNVLVRPVMYDSYHEVAIIKKDDSSSDKEEETAIVVGNICETGDIVVAFNAGAYGYAMSSNYNCRLRPAEVLIDRNGNDRLIRRRDTLESLVQNFITE